MSADNQLAASLRPDQQAWGIRNLAQAASLLSSGLTTVAQHLIHQSAEHRDKVEIMQKVTPDPKTHTCLRIECPTVLERH